MGRERLLAEKDLAELAKRLRLQGKNSRARAAREINVSQISIFQAEERPGRLAPA